MTSAQSVLLADVDEQIRDNGFAVVILAELPDVMEAMRERLESEAEDVA